MDQQHLSSEEPLGGGVEWHKIQVIDFFGQYTQPISVYQCLVMIGPSSIHFQSTDAYTNEELVGHGYLGTAPLKPTVAISLRTLHAY